MTTNTSKQNAENNYNAMSDSEKVRHHALVRDDLIKRGLLKPNETKIVLITRNDWPQAKKGKM